MQTEQNQSNLIEVDIIDDAPKSDSTKFVTVDELQEILNNRPHTLLEKALEKIDSNHAKLRSLYRSQLFVDAEHLNSELGVADGSDCELIQVIYDDLKELKAIISKALAQLETK